MGKSVLVYLFTAVLFFSCSNIFCQDNFMKIHYPNCQDTTETSVAYEDILSNMSRFNFSIPIEDLKKTYCYSKRKNDPKIEATSLYLLAKAYIYSYGSLDSLRTIYGYLERSIELSEAHNIKESFFASQEILCSNLTANNQFGRAAVHGYEFLNKAKQLKDSSKILEGHMLLGRLRRDQGNYSESDSLLQMALNYHVESSQEATRACAYTYLHLANLYLRQEKYDKMNQMAKLGSKVAGKINYIPDARKLKIRLYAEVAKGQLEQGLTVNDTLLNKINEWASIEENHRILSQYYYINGFSLENQKLFDKSIKSYFKSIKHIDSAGGRFDDGPAFIKLQQLLENTGKTSELSSEFIEIIIQAMEKQDVRSGSDVLFERTFNELKNEKVMAEILQKDLKSSHKFNIAITIAVLVLFLGFIIAYYQYRQKHNFHEKVLELNQDLESNVRLLSDKTHKLSEYQKELEQIITQREKGIERLEKFSAILSHDFKEPAQTIVMYGNIINGSNIRESLNDEEETIVANMVESSKRLLEVVDVLFKYSSNTLKMMEDFHPINLNELVHAVTEDLSMRIDEKNAEVQIEQLPNILGVKALIYQLFSNLLTNSLKYHRPNVAPKIKISSKFENELIIVMIKDNGRGIEKEEGVNVFSGTVRGSNVVGSTGLGLGLNISKEIVEVHGGKIWYDSKPNEETIFYISFNGTSYEDEIPLTL